MNINNIFCLAFIHKSFFVFLLVSHAFVVKADDKKPNKQPNIIFILADDLGWGELGSYGNNFNETPNLDYLAANGKKFSHAYAAAPVCSPTRASIMTGQYPARVRITDYLTVGEKTERFLDPNLYTTLNEALAHKGYHTGIIGKWHLDTHFDKNAGSAEAHGFHEVIGTETSYIAGGDYFFPYGKINTYKEGSENEYLTDRQSSDACEFIKKNKTKPFFLYLSYYSVHTRLDAPKILVDKYKKKFDKKNGSNASDIFERNPGHETNQIDNPYLAAMLERIDAGVGSVIKTLKETGLAENTIVVFTSDNGGAGRVANNGNLRSYKTWLYEGGVRVPLLVYWPNSIKPSEISEPVSSIDFYPTFVAAAGGNISDYHVDGENLMPLLKGVSGLKRKELYWHYPAETQKWTDRMATTVRQGDYKLIKQYLGSKDELYNLKSDPSEVYNLASKEPEKVKELTLLIEKWKKQVNAEEPDAEALKKAGLNTPTVNQLAETRARKRHKELDALGLSGKQSQDIYDMLYTFFKNDEEIKRKQMNPEDKKKAQQENNKQRQEKFLEILSTEQMKMLRELRKQEG